MSPVYMEMNPLRQNSSDYPIGYAMAGAAAEIMARWSSEQNSITTF